MFPRFVSRNVLRIYQVSYCESDYSKCARYKLAITGKMPDAKLLPDGTTLQHFGE